MNLSRHLGRLGTDGLRTTISRDYTSQHSSFSSFGEESSYDWRGKIFNANSPRNWNYMIALIKKRKISNPLTKWLHSSVLGLQYPHFLIHNLLAKELSHMNNSISQ